MKDITTYHSFIWIKDVQKYSRSVSLLEEGILPVLLPSDKHREERWTHILTWYGLSPYETNLVPTPCSKEVRSTDFVVALGKAYREPAYVYATAQRRSFVVIEADDLQDFLDNITFTSLLIMGPPTVFTAQRLRQLNQHVLVPWGLLTAQDLEGATFVVAKLLAGAAQRNDCWAVIDVLFNRVVEYNQSGNPHSVRQMESEYVKTLVCNSNWDTLVLHAHGEGGHANLESVVLCGLVNDVEYSRSGEPIDGCKVESHIRRCKRVHNPNIHILSFKDLKTRRFCFLSCNGFSVAGELYPSDVSCILACAEGYPVAILANDRPTPIDPWVPDVLVGLLKQQSSFSDLLQLKNDQWMRQSRSRPYILFGDPCDSETMWVRPDEGGWIAIETEETVVKPLFLDNRNNPDIIGLHPFYPGTHIVRGYHRSAILLPKRDQRENIRIVDKTDVWQKHFDLLLMIGLRLHHAVHLGHSIGELYTDIFKGETGFKEGVAKLTEIRMALEIGFHRALNACESIRQRGVWNNVLASKIEKCISYVQLWDRCFAMLIRSYLFAGPDEAILANGCTVPDWEQDIPCNRCGSLMVKMRAVSPLNDQPDSYRIDCPTCGPREMWSDGRARLLASIPNHIRLGDVIEINVKLSDENVISTSPVQTGFLIIEFKDKGRGQVFFQSLKHLSHRHMVEEGHVCHIHIPQNLCADLHTIKLAWVLGLDVTFQRLRCPGMR